MVFKIHIRDTLKQLLAQEDTDGDTKITVEDQGPKCFLLKNKSGNSIEIKGTYHLSNLLQELVLAMDTGEEIVEIPLSKIEELPTHRISRMIRDYYWNGLTRSMDELGIEALLKDTKNESLEATSILRVYVPYKDGFALNYYQNLQKRQPLEVIQLPETITPQYVKSINNQPGILSLKLLEKDHGGACGVPFVVPGGRFNEMYGWDSYFESIGLLLDDRVDLARAMADNFQYEIEHYGKILNANRSYYLTRTQPPFYSSLIAEVYEKNQDKHWLESHLKTCIKEYETVWMVLGKRLVDNGLNRYLAEGIGQPPEAEAGHFHHEIGPYARATGIGVSDYEKGYQNGTIQNPQLDDYFVHDRSVRESGHDTSYRLEGICADLNVVELNAFLYKYEMDFSELIQTQFDDCFSLNGKDYTSAYWQEKAQKRKALVNTFLWNEAQGMYFDYNFKKREQTHFVSATLFTPLWAGMASKEQAEKVVEKALPLLMEKGGVASCTMESRGAISKERPQKQWDYPNGWAPHQMMIWRGLKHYGYEKEMEELVYRWLFMITKNAVDYNGTIPEKYDVVSATHKVFAEYGNVGTEFQYITKEGFGWMNASFQYGMSLLRNDLIQKLNTLTPPESLFQ
ncbi:MAG TPA: trehalase family glycosidase [Flavobacteriaceae bacterium]|nr:trehalase [Flavobacteriaceae bacterium]MCB9213920.1 trehalase [Alteromonas sp.]HPF11095.1 trehalase family glycosidase [Flavobacteriaceae bacterium]HQU21237.1 trehalase family glycosidase [Flavobacteriaceae bacterium]HQU65709.1 trehalase family glycosidase [Flavobacteriaceae bacterium]